VLPTGPQIRTRGARDFLVGALVREILSSFLLVFLLIGGLPCATLFGCGCPCPSPVAGSNVLSPAPCCEASTEATQILSLPIKLQNEMATLPIVSAESPNASEAPLLPELARLSLGAVRLYDPPPLILLLCTLLN
jgi:hypothetical protein